MPSAQPTVFLSYSRRDYYFAESCALHLMDRGFGVWLDVKDLPPGEDWHRNIELGLDRADVFVLLASPDSLASAQVEVEWRAALARGGHVVVARIRGRQALPGELATADVVDFRGRFAPALDALIARLRGQPKTEAAVNPPRWPRLPPWVLILASQLVLLALLPLGLADYGEVLSSNTDGRVGLLFFLLVILAIFLWFVLGAFLRRRAGLTHVLLTFVFFVWSAGYPLLQHAFPRQLPQWFPEATMRWVRSFPELIAILAGVAAFGIVILVVIQPEDVLRWLPTGTAWRRLRIAHRGRVSGTFSLEGRLRALGRFRVVADQDDDRAAAHLRQLLRQLDVPEVTGNEPATTVLLLTNRTRMSWLESEAAGLKGPFFAVVGTGIRLPVALASLWRRQCLDLRRWDTRDRESGLPAVPEGLGRHRFPAAVATAHHVLCSMAALLFVVGSGLTSESDELTDSAIGIVAFLLVALAVAWGLVGRALLNRTIAEAALTRRLRLLSAAGLVLGLVALSSGHAPWSLVRAIPAAAFLVSAPVWLWRNRGSLSFWLPTAASADPRRERLWPGRTWRTLLWSLAYGIAWTGLLMPE